MVKPRPASIRKAPGKAADHSQLPFTAALDVATQAPTGFLDHMAGILIDYIPADRQPGAPLNLAFYGASARLVARTDHILVEAQSADRGALASMKYLIAWNLREYLGTEAKLHWNGEDGAAPDLPQFREMCVVDAWQITARMRRVRLTGHDLGRFASGGLHVQLLLPPRGRIPVWPKAAPSGIPSWPEGDDRLTLRTYTMRHLDHGAGFVDIDVVLHEGDSPGSDWARAASPGDPVGMMGPGGGGVLPADRMLMAGDETALPAIARMLEELPDDVHGTALIEVADDAEIQPLLHPPGFDLVWLSRNGEAAGTTTCLEDAVVGLQWPNECVGGTAEAEPVTISIWIGCEFQTFKRLRRHCRKVWGLKGKEQLIVAYWRREPDSDVAESR